MACRHLHALRFSHDPDYDVVFHGQRGGLAQAVTPSFSLGIIVLFTGSGIATTLLGPAGVVQLGSNPWVNGFISLMFFVFGLSLLGAFEITIPSGLLTKLNAASRRADSSARC